MAEKMFFDDKSIKLVKDFLMQDAEESRLEAVSHETQERSSENKAVPCRVPKHLQRTDQRIQNPNIVLGHHLLGIDEKIQNPYIPQVLSLGPYHSHSFTVEDVSTVLSQLDERMSSTKEASFKLKLKSAAAVLGILGFYGRDLEKKFEKIYNMWPYCQSFYNLSITEGENSNGFTLMMVLDSFFLMYFLSTPNQGEQRVDIKCDILKLENQIPLVMLQDIFKIFQFPKNYKLAYSLQNLLVRAYKQLSPFDLSHKSIPRSLIKQFDAALEKEPHLLGCLHAIISPHLEFGHLRDKYPEPTLLQRISRFLNHYVLANVCAIFFCFTRPAKGSHLIKKYTAGELAMAGIKFKYFFLLSDNIRFDAYSHTVYLPRMTVAPLQIEVLLCNLAALEFVDKKRRTTVTSFLLLMGNFIKTPDDVEMLKKSEVISYPAMLTNNDIAEIWVRMGSPFRYDASDQDLYHVEHLKRAINDWVIDNYHLTKVTIIFSRLKIGVRKLYHDFRQRYFSPPWQGVALVVAAFILFLNGVQAYCSWRDCNSKKPK